MYYIDEKKAFIYFEINLSFWIILNPERLYDYQNRPPLSLGMPRHIQPGVSPRDFDVH